MPIKSIFNKLIFLIFVLLFCLLIALQIIQNNTTAISSNMVFPVLGGGRYSNDFYAPRFNGTHYATDIIVPKHTPLVSPVDGVVYYLMYPQPSWGYSLGIRDDDGFEYNFLHLNDDNDGTKDSAGGPMKAYAPDMKVGNRVVKGQHIGWVGDSGYANGIPHLHFEIYDQNKQPINPYNYLRNATIINQPTIIYPAQPGESLPYGAFVNTKVQVAAGNLDLDIQKEYVTATGVGSTPHVRVFNRDYGFDDYGFFAYATNYTGGVNVATGDVDGDGVDEIITGTGPGSTSHVRIFEKNGQAVAGFFAYPGFNTGVNVATGDVDGDGVDEIITGTGPGSTSHVKVFSLNGVLINDFFAYPGYFVGTDVAAGDVDGDGNTEIVTSPATGSSHVKIFKPTGEIIGNFFAYPGFYGGVRIDVGNVVTDSVKQEILTAPYSNGGPDIRMYDNNGLMINNIVLYESWWSGGFDIAATDGFSVVGTGGNRRSSVRITPF